MSLGHCKKHGLVVPREGFKCFCGKDLQLEIEYPIGFDEEIEDYEEESIEMLEAAIPAILERLGEVLQPAPERDIPFSPIKGYPEMGRNCFGMDHKGEYPPT